MNASNVSKGDARAPDRFRFEGYTLDVRSETLTDPAGNRLHLRPKTLQVLIHLVKNRADLVSKQQLLQHIWQDTVVEDQAVFQSISEIRSLMQRSDCIRTAKGRGYQWTLETLGESGKPAFASVPPVKRRPTATLRMAAGTMACVLAVYWAFQIDFDNLAGADEATVSQPVAHTEAAVPVDALLRQAQLHLSRNQFDEARSTIDLVLAHFPEHRAARVDLAYLLKMSGDLAQAKSIASEVYNTPGNRSEPQARMSAALLLSEISLADRQLTRALALGEEALSDAISLDNDAMVAASLEQLAEVALTGNDRDMAKARLHTAMAMYGASCPSSVQRVQNKLLDMSSGKI